MNMKKTVLIIISGILFSLLFAQCKKECNSTQIEDKTFTVQQLAIVPYDGTETLVFKNLQGDSICFTGQGRASEMSLKYSNPDAGEDDCIGNYRNTETNSVKFNCGTDSLISLKLYFPFPFNELESLTVIRIAFCDQFNAAYSFYGDTINNYNLYYSYYGYSCPDFVSGYYSDISFGDKTFHAVYELMFYNSQGKTLYYSVSQGIVAYKESSGTIWYLDKMI